MKPPINYSNPYLEQGAQREQQFSVGSFVRNMAVGTIIAAGAEAVINVASRGMVKGLAPTLTRMGVNLTSIATRAARNKPGDLGMMAAKFLKFTDDAGNAMPSIGELIGNKLRGSALQGKFGTGIADFVKYEKAFDGMRSKSYTRFMERASNYFAPAGAVTNARDRFLAGTVVRTARVASELPAMYMVDKMFGRLYGYDVNEGKNPSDISGHIASFGKYAATTAPGLVLFKSAAIGVKAAKYGSTRLMENQTFQTTFVDPTMALYANVRTNIRAAGAMFAQEIAPRASRFSGTIYEQIANRSNGLNLATRMVRGTIRGAGLAVRAYQQNPISKERFGEFIQQARETDARDFQNSVMDNVEQLYRKMQTDKTENAREHLVNFKNQFQARTNRERDLLKTQMSHVYSTPGNRRVTRNTLEFNIADTIEDRLRNMTAEQRASADGQRWSNLLNEIGQDRSDFNFSVNHFVNINNNFIDLQKMSGRSTAASIGSRLRNVSIKVPFSNFSFITGKESSSVDIPIGRLLGADLLMRDYKPISPVMLGSEGPNAPRMKFIHSPGAEAPIPYGSRDTLTERILSESQVGGYIYGKPWVYNINDMSLQGSSGFISGKYGQRYIDIQGTLLERAYAKMQKVGEHTARIKTEEEQTDKAIQFKHYLYRMEKEGLTTRNMTYDQVVQQAERLAKDQKYQFDNFRMGIERGINRLSAKFEFGKYGAESGNAKSLLTKFFSPKSDYNYMETYGEFGNVISLLGDLNDNTINQYRNDPTKSFLFLNKLAQAHQKGKHIATTSARNIIMRTDMEQLRAGMGGAEFNTLRSLLDSPQSMREYLEGVVKNGGDNSIFDKLSDQERGLIHKSLSYLNNNQGFSELSQKYTDKIYGRQMTQLELINRTTMLVHGLEGAFNNTERNTVSDLLQNVIADKSIRYNGANNYASSIGSRNPFKIIADFSQLEKDHAFLSHKSIFMKDDASVHNTLEMLTEGISDLNRGAENLTPLQRRLMRAASADASMSELIHENGALRNQLLGMYTEYRSDLSQANRAAKGTFNGLFSIEPDSRKIAEQRLSKEDVLRKGLYVLSDLGYGTPKDIQDATSKHMLSYTTNYFLAERLNRVAGAFGIDMRKRTDVGDAMKTFALKRMLPLVVGLGAWQTADQLTDVLDVGAFDEGLNVFAAEKLIQLQDLTSRVRDKVGITDSSKYLEGLMPGFVNSPAARAIRTFGAAFGGAMLGTVAGNPAIGASIGLAAAGLQDFGMVDLTNSNEENKDVWSGKKMAPIRQGAGWLLSKAFYQGDRIQGWAPHWFARMKSQAEYSDVLYGSKAEALVYKPWPLIGINPVGSLLDPYHYERVNAANRPYLYTGSIGEEIPFIGPLVAAATQPLKPVKLMNTEALAGEGSASDPAFIDKQKRITMQAEAALMGGELGGEITGSANANIIAPTSPQGTAHQFMMKGVYQPLGIFGWMGKSVSQTIFGKDTPFAPDMMAESAGRMTSVAREYWSMGLGDAFLTNEFLRRMIPDQGSGFNPIANRFSWLPTKETYHIDFQSGDPYTKIPLGEFRLPGAGYERLHKVRRTFPIGASSAGYDPMSMAMTMAGITGEESDDLIESAQEGTKIHKMYQQLMIESGMAKAEEKFVYDPTTDIHGYMDIIGNQGEVIEIKTVQSTSDLDELDRIKEKHRAQLNVYLHAADQQFGKVIYVSRDDPSKTKEFTMGRDAKLYAQTIKNVSIARQIAGTLDQKLLAPGAGYSHLDRFRILSDVAPFSKDYFQEKTVLDEQARLGMLSQSEYYNYYEGVKMAESQMRPLDVYPTRFLGLSNILQGNEEVYGVTNENIEINKQAAMIRRGDKTDIDYENIRKGLDSEYNMFNLNSSIKDASSYTIPERMIGAAWEAGLKVQIPYASRKFMQYWTPMEAYRRNILQGSKDAYWNDPISSFTEPMSDQFRGSTNFAQGSLSGATIGGMVGGLPGSFIGGALGGIYGTIRGTLEDIGISGPYIKEDVRNVRTVERYFDDMKAESAKQEYMRTGRLDVLKEYERTLEGSAGAINPYFGTFAGMPSAEKSYISLITASGNESMIKDMQRYIPEDNAARIDQLMGKMDSAYAKPYSNAYDGPAIDWAVANDDTTMDKMKYEVMKDSGYNTYLAGLGWKNQMIDFSRSRSIVDLRNPGLKQDIPLGFSEGTAKNIIYTAMRETGMTGMVVATNDGSPEIRVEII